MDPNPAARQPVRTGDDDDEQRPLPGDSQHCPLASAALPPRSAPPDLASAPASARDLDLALARGAATLRADRPENRARS